MITYQPGTNSSLENKAGESTFGSGAIYTKTTDGSKGGFVWSEYDSENDVTKLRASMTCEDGYTEPVTIYETTGEILRCIAPTLNDDGSWEVVANAQQVTEAGDGRNSLIWIGKNASTKIHLDSLYVDENDVTDEGTAIEYSFENTGDEPVEAVNLDVKLANDTVISQTIEKTVQPGERVTGTCYVDLGEKLDSQQVELSMYAEGQEDVSENTFSDAIGKSDIKVSSSATMTGNGISIYTSIENISTQSATVNLNVYTDENKSEKLTGVTDVLLGGGAKESYCITIPTSKIVSCKARNPIVSLGQK